jgi:hypothetical protein
MHQIPPTILLFGNLTGIFMWLHIVLAICARVALRADAPAINELFAFGPLGRSFSHKPYLMRLELFFPWVKIHGLVGHSPLVNGIVWLARFAGAGFLVSFIGVLVSFAYAAIGTA